MSRRETSAASLEQALRFEDEHFSFSPRGPRAKTGRDEDAWVGIVETLYSEHAYLAALLDRLEEAASRLEPGKVPDYGLLLEIIDYLTHYPDQYHHPREDLLFGSLLRSDQAFERQLARLQREHQALHGYNDELFAELSAIAGGRPVDRRDLRERLGRYLQGYRQHLEYESREIFPRAEGTLAPEEIEALDAKTRYIDDPIFGGRLQRRYRRLARKLRVTAGELHSDAVAGEIGAIQSIMDRLSRWTGTIGSLGEDLDGSLRAAWADRIDRPKRDSAGAPRPSWQARVMNACMRVTAKPMMRYGSVDSMRRLTTRLEEQQARNIPGDVETSRVERDGYAGQWVRIRGRRPREIILYFPGGGFVMAATAQHRAFVARLCRAANRKALVVHYRLAPEVPFPGGLEDCLAAYHDLLEQGHAPEDITLAGDSAGGGLVLSTLLALRDEGTPLPANAIVLSPLADLTYSGESREYNKDRDPMLPTHRASEMHQVYIGDVPPEDRFVSPVFADFDGLPPILGQVGSTEILLDDTVRAADQAKKAGVPFFLEVWNEMPHVFPIFAILPESHVAVERIAEFIQSCGLEPLPERYGRAA